MFVVFQLTVVIKRQDDCAERHFLTYQAQTDYLPATFDDGREYAGLEKSVQITEVDAGKHVEIYLRYIDTTIIVRQIGRYFTFAIRMPEEIVNMSLADDPDSIQLCAKGCPKSERINYKEFLAQKHSRLKDLTAENSVMISRDTAEEKCRSARVVDFYFDSCVFDLMTTGDSNFTLAAYHALQDVLRLHPRAASMHENRTNLDKIDQEYNIASSLLLRHNSLHRTCTLLLLVYCTVILTRISSLV